MTSPSTEFICSATVTVYLLLQTTQRGHTLKTICQTAISCIIVQEERQLPNAKDTQLPPFSLPPSLAII